MQPDLPGEGAPGRRELAGGVLILLFLVALFHGPALGFGFVYDDAWTIVGNAFLREPGNIWALLGPEPARSGVPDAGRPTLLATLILDQALWGLHPRGFHLQSLLWHAGTVILFFLGAARLAGAFLLPFTAAALFAVHPVNVEAVAAINYREDLLSASFTLGALTAIGAARRTRGVGAAGARALAFLLLLIGIFAKENAIVAPVLLVVLDVCFPGTFGAGAPARVRWSDAALLASAVLVGFFWRFWVMDAPGVVSLAAEIPEDHRHLAHSVPRAALALAAGAAKLVWPWWLSPDYAEKGPWAGPAGLAICGLYVALAVIALRRRESAPLFALAVLGTLAAALPTLGFVPLSNLQADRYLYFPSLPLLFGLGALLLRGLAGVRLIHGPAVFEVPRPWWVVGVLVMALGVRTLGQARIWRDDLALWTHATRAEPDSARAWAALAEARMRRGDTMAALDGARRSLALSDDGHTHGLLGVVLMQQGDLTSARRELLRALEQAEPHHRAEALNNLGYCEMQLGQLDAALERFREAQDLARPDYDRPWLNAARALERKGDLVAATATLRQLLQRMPGNTDARHALVRIASVPSGGPPSEPRAP